MSNLIKAYSVRYSEDTKKVIDTNAAAEERLKNYMELMKNNEEASNDLQTDPDGFVQGLVAATVEELSEDEIQSQKDREQEQRCQEVLEQKQQESAQNLQKEAQSIIADAKEEVKQLLKDATAEAETVKANLMKQAKEEGYQEGKKMAELELNAMKEELNEKKDQLEADYEKKIKEFEPKFVELLISFIQRFTGVILDDKKDIILYLLEKELLNIDNSNTYLIRVSKEDYDMVNSKKNEIQWKLKDGAELEIVEDRMLGRAQCMIETDSRIIDCSLDVQLKNLTGDLKLLAGIRSEGQEQAT